MTIALFAKVEPTMPSATVSKMSVAGRKAHLEVLYYLL